MIKLTKGPAPDILAQNRVKWADEYEAWRTGRDVPAAAQYRYRHPEIKTALRAETFDKCVYCESKISHIHPGETDHIDPLHHRPDRVVDWDNLAYICHE